MYIYTYIYIYIYIYIYLYIYYIIEVNYAEFMKKLLHQLTKYLLRITFFFYLFVLCNFAIFFL